jgi:hypothetical protein
MAPKQRKLFRVFFQGQDHFFQNKEAAKKFAQDNGLKGVVVHRGPDHWRGTSDGTSKRTRGSRSTW